MATAQLNRITQHLCRTLTAQALGEATDAALLERFTGQGDEAAFAALVRRHGPMVLGACRRVLHNLHDAEDAFQAAFLLLARKAGSIRQREALAGWLFAVARRLALRLRAGADRRHALETQVKAMTPTEFPADLPELDAEQRFLLDEELGRLPEKYRAALLVCYLEGKTRAEAARQLGWKPGAVKIRLERGRELLRSRLKRRGLALPAAALATVLAETGTAPAIPPALLQATVQGAMLLGAGKAALAGIVSERTLALVEGMRKTMLWTKLKIVSAILLVASALGSGASWFRHPSALAQAPAPVEPGAPAAAEKQPATDIHGDPLPPGARARLGSLRFRHESNVTFVAYTPDGKYLITSTQNGVIRKWDAATGKELLPFGKPPAMPQRGGVGGEAAMPAQMKRWRGPQPGRTALALAPDGTTLAVAGPGNAITLWDVATGKQGKQWNAANPVFLLTFSPDGKQLISRGQDQRLRLWDVAEGKEIRAFGEQPKPQQRGGVFLAFDGNGRVAFSADGKFLLTQVLEQDQNQFTTVVKRYEVATGLELPVVKGTQGSFESVVYAPDGKISAWSAANTGKVRLFDLETGKDIRDVEGARAIHTFSPDGKFLVGRTEKRDLAIWETSTGKMKHKLTSEPDSGVNVGNFVIRFVGGVGGETVAFSADNANLAAGDGTVVRQWTVADGKEKSVSAGHTAAVSQVAFASDGKSVLSRGADHTLRTWDAAGRQTASLSLPAAAHAVFSPDGQTLILARQGTIHVWDAKTGKEVRQWKAHEKAIGGLALSTDGKLIVSRGYDQTIRVWETATGKEIKQIVEPGSGAAANPVGQVVLSWAGAGGHSPSVVLSPDAASLATFPAGVRQNLTIIVNGQNLAPQDSRKAAIHLWDVATGKLIRKFADLKSGVVAATFAPDGRTLAAANTDGTVSLWETLTGKERLSMKCGQVASIRFSADGKFLVTGGEDGTIGFWDPATGKELGQRKGHQGAVTGLALAADGKTLVSGSRDTTALVWDVPTLDLARAAPVTLESAQLEALWKDLAGGDPRKAHEAARTLAADPSQALPLLRERLQPVPVPDPKRLAQLVADLDHRQFAVRQKAETELETLGELADPALKQVLAGQPPLETRQRVEKLREKIVTVQMLPTEKLQALRAVAVLEAMGTAEARQVLEKLGQGADGARQTLEAKAALARLGRQAANSR